MKLFRKLSDKFIRRRTDRPHSSVQDCKNEQELKRILSTGKLEACCGGDDASEGDMSETSTISAGSAHSVEWKLPFVDTFNSEPQTMEKEFQRLKVLQSYFILDSEGEKAFDHITRLAAELFEVPICVVSLIDLGRFWCLSKVGLEGDVQGSRKESICGHTILNKHKILVVPDASQDVRFKCYPSTTGEPYVRFYAGAALVAPEGYNLGTLCVVSPIPRPGGISEREKRMLQDMSAMVVDAIVARRDRLLKAELESQIHDLGQSFVQTATSLKRTKTAISAMVKEKEAPIAAGETNHLASIVNELDIQANVCNAAARTLLDTDQKHIVKEKNDTTHSSLFDIADQLDDILEPTTDLQQLYGNLCALVEKIPRSVPVTLELDGSVPSQVVSEDLLLFRSSFNLVMHALGRSEPAGGSVNFKIRADNEYLVFECQDHGPLVPREKVKQAFHDANSLLAPVATMVRTMIGYYGMRLNVEENQTIFWFRIPIQAPDDDVSEFADDNPASPGTVGTTMRKSYAALTGAGANGTFTDDPFKAALFQQGCCIAAGRR